MKIAIPGLILAAVAEAALAQQLPSAGGQLRQLPPLPQAGAPVLRDLRPERPAGQEIDAAAGPSFSVATLRITGMTAFPESRLVAVAGFTPGAVLTLGDLRQMAARITDFYTARGYFVAQAYLPPQALTGETVTLSVIEGHYGAVAVKNGSRVSNATTRRIMSGLDSGDIVANAPLQRRLLLLADLPGTQVHSTIAAGAEVGTSDLLVDIGRGRRVTGEAYVDNGGNRYTGYYRAGGSVNFSNPFGVGDVVSVNGLVSNGGLTYVRASYQAPIGALTLGVAYARLDYRLGREFSALDAHGSADIASVFGTYPLVRSYDFNLYLLAAANLNFYHDEIDTTASIGDKRSETGSLVLSGNSRDRGGSNFWSIGWTVGNLDIRTPSVRAVDDVTARTDGGFHKFNFAVGRTQTITGALSLYLAARGQLASQNLDISEKMELGGAYGVRSYPEGEAFGDQGYIVTAEARLIVARRLPGDLAMIAFVDHGGVTFNRNRFSTAPNSTRLSGVGGGVTWLDSGNFQLRAYYAHRLGSTPVLSGPDASGQFWVQATKSF